MEKVLVEFGALGLTELVISAAIIFIPVMGLVYLCGKMLGIARTPRAKNSVAALGILIFSSWKDYLINGLVSVKDLPIRMWGLTVLVSLVIILYVLIGQRLFSRFDSFLDRKVGEDKLDEDKVNDSFFKMPNKKITKRRKS